MIWSVLEALKESAGVIRGFQLKEKNPKSRELQSQNISLYEIRLMAIYTAEEIINGPGMLFDIDEKEILQCFYQILFDLFQVLQDGLHIIHDLVLRLGVDLELRVDD